MARPLTSWKEIAQYLGKGVRTVQRWERTFGLPVRRPAAHSKGIVFALAEDLDSWLHQQHEQQQHEQRNANLNHEIERLRAALSEVTAENQALRAQLGLSSKPQSGRPPEVADGPET